MLHVPLNIRAQIPSPTLSPTVEQKEFIPTDNVPIVIESQEEIVYSESPPIESLNPQNNDSVHAVVHPESPVTMSPPIGSPSMQNNILTQPTEYQVR